MVRVERPIQDRDPNVEHWVGSPRGPVLLARNFWYIDALAAIGRRDEARALLIDLLAHRNALGLFSEDIHPEAWALWGKIPKPTRWQESSIRR
jgi:GH15 family glucan-1,4-alpha-glucosidase